MITPTATRNTTRSGHPTDPTHLRHHLLVLWNTLKMILGYPDYPPRELLLRAFSVRIPISEYSTPDPAALVILKTIPRNSRNLYHRLLEAKLRQPCAPDARKDLFLLGWGKSWGQNGASSEKTAYIQQVAAQMTYQASWRHERIFRRPEREDRRSARARDGQEPSHPHLLRLALLRQTLRQTRRGGSLASPQEETRLKTQAR